MKRSELEKYLGNKVKILLFDDKEEIGYLQKSDPNNANVPRRNRYFTTDEKVSQIPNGIVFRCSHVEKVKLE